MMGPKHTYEQLLEKIVRAKVKLESSKRRHEERCMVELDPEYYGECTCGTSDHNSMISDALDELKL